MQSFLKIGVVLSFIISVVSLTILIFKTYTFGKKPLYAQSKGSIQKGILYAFGRGMMPWEKESARKHLMTYALGITYHTGIFGAIFYLFLIVLSVDISGILSNIYKLLFIMGLLSGLIFFFKRMLYSPLQKISCLDDFLANLIVNIFLACAFIQAYFKNSTLLFFMVSIAMFLYIPLGKIRHCFFFFYIRFLFGLFYGRRNVLPPKKDWAKP